MPSQQSAKPPPHAAHVALPPPASSRRRTPLDEHIALAGLVHAQLIVEVQDVKERRRRLLAAPEGEENARQEGPRHGEEEGELERPSPKYFRAVVFWEPGLGHLSGPRVLIQVLILVLVLMLP